MTTKTRYFLVGSAALLVVGLTVGLVASLGSSVAFTGAAGPDELRYVPPQASVVAFANVQEVMASELRQRLRKIEPDGADRDEFEQKTGVDIERDIDAVVAAMLPGATAGSGDGVLVVARGRFDVGRIEHVAREHGGEALDYQGVRVVTHAGRPGADPQSKGGALGFIEPGVIAVGSAEAVRAAIDAKQSGKSVLDNTDVMRLVSDLDPSNAWAVGRFDAVARRGELPGGLGAKIPTLTWFSAAGHLNGGISGTVKAEAKDADAAKNLRDMLQGVVAMVRLQAGDRPELKGLIDSLQLGGNGSTVAVAFSVPAETFELLDSLDKKRRDARPAER